MAAHAHLESFRRAHQQGNEERAQREMENGLRYLKEAVVESRRLVNGLRTLALDDLGIAGALEQLVAEEKARSGWDDANIVHNVAGRRFDWTLETAAYRVAQEALTNVRKHAEASHVHVMVMADVDAESGEQQLTVEVRDWGKGFDPEHRTDSDQHVGLNGMAERVRLMGGTLDLTSAPGEGTAVRAVFPAREPEPEKLPDDTSAQSVDAVTRGVE
jgi:signal transduction histidine kinase